MSAAIPQHPYVERAERYARDVVDGKIPANRKVRKACERHFKDKRRALSKAWPYRFDPERAEEPCRFIEGLPHTKGAWARRGEKLLLGDWQCFLVCSLFGWVHRETGFRRFRVAYWEIPRKNGKSPLGAAIGLYMWAMDGETGAEVYAGATTEDQAWKVFGPAKMMLEKTPQLQEFVGAQPFAKSLVIERDGSIFRPIIGKPGDGDSPSCAIADERHEHDTNDLVDAMETGMLARDQPIMLKITTAGVNLAGPCYEDHLYAIKVLEGTVEDDTLFAVIYGIDEEDDWTRPEMLRKANPNYGVSVNPEILASEHRKAVINPLHQNRFRTKHLNVWCSAKLAWMDMAAWQENGDPALKEEEFEGQEAFFILDLASKSDLACYGKLFERELNGIPHWYFFANYYVPETALEGDDNPNAVSYRRWAQEGWLTATEGAEIDFDVIEADVERDLKRFRHIELAYDPWRATQLAQRMTKKGALCVELRQTVQNISLPMKEVYSATKAMRLHHDRNPATTWCVANVVAKTDAKDNIYPRKPTPHSPLKIDGAVTLIMGVARALARRGGEGTGNFREWMDNVLGVTR